MSLGLLRGLAARALGVDTPLRSQRARSDSQPAEPGEGGELAPWGSPLQAEVRQPAAAPPHAAVEHVELRVAAPDAAVPDKTSATPSPIAMRAMGNSEARPHSVRLAPAADDRDVSSAKSPSSATADAAADATATATPVQHEARASQQHAAVKPAPTARTTQDAAPAPLLPLSAPPALPPAMAVTRSSPGRRADRHRQGAAEAPTEVHVSIGRVDLTALTPTATARSPVRREGPAGHSLAEYLRGPGAKRQS